MNFKMVGFVLGRIFLIEAVLMLCPTVCSALYGEWNIVLAFLWPILGLGSIGGVVKPPQPPQYHDLRPGRFVDRGVGMGIDVGIWGAALCYFRRDPVLF